jgi:hypothetical protein
MNTLYVTEVELLEDISENYHLLLKDDLPQLIDNFAEEVEEHLYN